MNPPPADLATRLHAGRELLLGAGVDLTSIGTDDLPGLAARAAALVAAARAFQAAVVLEAEQRGVIASSDNPKAAAWVEQTCRDAGVPVTSAQARALGEVVSTCSGYDIAPLRDAVTRAETSVEAAAMVAATYRRLRRKIELDCWDVVLDQLIEWSADGMTKRELDALEDALVGQYGTQDCLEDEHDQLYQGRDFTALRRNPRTGLYEARMVMDPANEAVFTAALNSLSAPQPDPDSGEPDDRTPGQRRLDALVTMARHATNPDRKVRGTGAAARVVVTIRLIDLISGLAPTTLGEQLGFSSSTVEGAVGEVAASDRGAGPFAPDPTRPGGGYGITGYGQVLSPETVRMLACDAQIIPAVFGTTSELLDLGHAKRLVTPGLSTAIELRDEHCTYPGCRVPAAWCDRHHIQHWARNGSTSLENCCLLCRHHHTVVHRFDHTATVSPLGVQWFRTDGSPIGNQLRDRGGGPPGPRSPSRRR